MNTLLSTTLPLSRDAIKLNHSLRGQGERIARLSLDQELSGSFKHIEMIEDALRQMTGEYRALLSEYERAENLQKAQAAGFGRTSGFGQATPRPTGKA